MEVISGLGFDKRILVGRAFYQVSLNVRQFLRDTPVGCGRRQILPDISDEKSMISMLMKKPLFWFLPVHPKQSVKQRKMFIQGSVRDGPPRTIGSVSGGRV